MKLQYNVLIFLVLIFACQILAQAKVVGTVQIPFDTNLSLAVYREGIDGGQYIRTIYELHPVKSGERVSVEWDGKDEAGSDMPAGRYWWKAIFTDANAYDDGWIGDMAEIPYGYLNEHGLDVMGVWIDANGDVYETSGWEEAHQEIRVWDKNGVGLRQRSSGGGAEIKADDKYIYQVAARDWVTYTVFRFTKDTLKQRNWMGTFYGDIRMDGGVNTIAVDDKYLWIGGQEEIHIRDKVTAAVINKIQAEDILGLAIDPVTGNCWASNSGDRVTEYTINGDKLREITGIQMPRSLSIGGPGNHLYIANLGDYPVLEYSISQGEPTLVREMFRAAKPGRVYDDAFLWQHANSRTSVAVGPDGNIAIADKSNQRVMIYDKDLNLIRQRFSEMVTAPMINAEYPEIVTSNNLEYMVNYYPGLDYGKWIVLNNWFGSSGNVRVKIDGKDYLFSVGMTDELKIFDITDGTMRSCGALIFPAAVRYYDKDEDGILTESEIMNDELHGDKVIKMNEKFWIGTNNKVYAVQNDAQIIVWNDKNSDGEKDIAEFTVYNPGLGYRSTLGPGQWVDNFGNYWVASWGGNTVKVSVEKLDENNNPIYNFDNYEAIIKPDDSEWRFNAANMRVDPANGDIYRVGSSARYPRTRGYGFWMGGTVVSRHRADGTLISFFPITDGFDAVVIATDSNGQFYYQGFSDNDQLWTKVYTNDNLLAAVCRMGGPSGSSGGWMDHGLSMDAFTHPTTGVHYVYCEEVFWGKSIRFRIDNLDDINSDPRRRASAAIDWTP